MRSCSFFVLLFFLVVCFSVTGCGEHVRVHGKVVFSDGKPLGKGMVCFQNDKFVARGVLQSNGSYALDMGAHERGILPGTYSVFVSGAVDIEQVPPPKGFEIPKVPKETPLIDVKYMGPETSGISCEVVKGMKLPFNITVEPPK